MSLPLFPLYLPPYLCHLAHLAPSTYMQIPYKTAVTAVQQAGPSFPLLLCLIMHHMLCIAVCMLAGQLLYLMPLGAGQGKGGSTHGWGTPLHSFWCCYGSSVESFAKLVDSIYFYR